MLWVYQSVLVQSSCCCRDRLFATSDLQFHLAAHFRWADGYLHLLEMTKLLAIDLSLVKHPNFSIFSMWSVCGVKDKDVRWYETGPDYNCWYSIIFIYIYIHLYQNITKRHCPNPKIWSFSLILASAAGLPSKTISTYAPPLGSSLLNLHCAEMFELWLQETFAWKRMEKASHQIIYI